MGCVIGVISRYRISKLPGLKRTTIVSCFKDEFMALYDLGGL